MILLLLLLFMSESGISFFQKDEKIDYWKTTPPKKEVKKSTFNWANSLNPQSKEFFKEGDYTPPQAFMELARDPSDQNITNWLKMIEMKNNIMKRLHENMNAYLVKHQTQLKTEEKNLITEKMQSLNPKMVPIESIKRYKFQLYFDSNCHHCQKMMESMKELSQLGYYIEVKQIDKNRPSFSIPFPLIPTTAKELKQKNIHAWPVLFVADLKKEVIYRINGYLPTNEILKQLLLKESK